MSHSSSKWLVETDWLAEHLTSPGVVVVDATLRIGQEGKSGLESYREAHIPGAVFFDIDEISDTASFLPHMLPSPEKFASRVRKLGIGDGMKIVVYDAKGIFSAPRAWWMFRVMGHGDVAVLNGGLPKWRQERRPLESGPAQPRSERHFTVRRNAGLVRDLSDMKQTVAAQTVQIADARAKGRFEGREPELRPVPRLGAMPGAKNLPYGRLLEADGTLLLQDKLAAEFSQAGIDVAKPVIASCGSGISACILALGLAVLGNEHAAVYDGSWAEWSQAEDAPVVSPTS